jgi:hypothetical protein
MKKSKFSEEQIAFVLKQAETGNSGQGDRPEARDPGDHPPSLEAELWWIGDDGALPPSTAR